MAPSSNSGGRALPTPSTEPEPKPKAKRRTKRTRLLTTTNPLSTQERPQQLETGAARNKYPVLAPAAPVGKGGPVGRGGPLGKGYVTIERRKTVPVQVPSPTVSPQLSTFGSYPTHIEDLQHFYPASSSSWYAGSAPSEDGTDTDERSHNQLAFKRSNKIIQFEDTPDNEDLQTRLLVEKLMSFNIGSATDPFRVLPQFKSPELDSVWLLRKSGQSFRSTASMDKWISRILFQPHLMLSSTILASTWIDMRSGIPGDSKRTVMAKAETMNMINERLRHPVTQLDDGTLVIIGHLLAGEVRNCNEKVIGMHQAAIARLIAHRGGVDCIKWEFAIETIASNIFHCNVFCETDPLPVFRDWEPADKSPPDYTSIPESPLYCPGGTFATIVNDPQCSTATHELLCNMRDLTELFTTDASADAQFDLDIWNTGCPKPFSADDGIMAIRKRLVSLPSAYSPGLPTTNDWVYEACRIAALIYTAAIIMRIPFAAAADPQQNSILSDLGTPSTSQDPGYAFTTPLTEILYEVLERTASYNSWNDMSGVFYWVTAVGAAAARTPVTINLIQQPRFRSEVYTVWIRRCFVMFSLRTLVLTVFKHPVPTIMGQKKLLKVQGLIRASVAKQAPE